MGITAGDAMSNSEDKGEQTRFMLRLPAELDEKMNRGAQMNNRSKNRHIVHLLDSASSSDAGSTRQPGNDMDEQGVLKWFRSLSNTHRKAFLTLTRDHEG